VIAIPLVIELAAHAASVKVCVTLNVSYNDSAVGDRLTGTTVTANGIHIRYTDVGTGTQTFLWADDNLGANPGCATKTLTAPTTIDAFYAVQLGTNQIHVHDKNGNQVYANLLTNWTPVAGTQNFSIGGGTSPYADILGATSHALIRRDGGLTNEDFTFRWSDNTSHGNEFGAGFSWIANYDDKFVVAHEFGHQIVIAANGGVVGNHNYGAPMDECSSAYTANHEESSKEYTSGAAPEGIASFYAAIAFNDADAHADCDYAELNRHDKYDWNGDGTADHNEYDFVDYDIFSCEDGFTSDTSVFTVPDGDYLGEYCIDGGLEDYNNRATQYDFLRAFWDLATDDGAQVPFDDIVAMWVAAPDTWLATDTIPMGKDCTDYPAARLQAAADGLTISAWGGIADFNGVYRWDDSCL